MSEIDILLVIVIRPAVLSPIGMHTHIIINLILNTTGNRNYNTHKLLEVLYALQDVFST